MREVSVRIRSRPRKKISSAGMVDFHIIRASSNTASARARQLGTDYANAFFLEYVCRGDEEARPLTPARGHEQIREDLDLGEGACPPRRRAA